MPRKTANMQPTVAELAAAANVSERMVFYCRQIARSGRDDLVAEMKAGTLTVNRALILAGLKRKPTRLEALTRAWNAATAEERAWFYVQVRIEDEDGDTDQETDNEAAAEASPAAPTGATETER